MAEPNLAVVVLAWNQPQLTERCIDSIRANTDTGYELIVVDNGSAPPLDSVLDDTGDLLVRLDENLGFAAGMNRGLERATAPHVAFVNNDTEFPPQWAGRLLETLRDHTGAGVVVPAVTVAGNPVTVRTTPGRERIVLSPFRTLPSAVVYLMNTATIRQLGGWNESYVPATAEDLDLLWTVWVNGLDVVFDERVLVEHVGSATIAAELPRRGHVLRTNRKRFVDRWAGDNPAPARLATVEEAVIAANMDKAAIAAVWMRRAFEAEDALAEMERSMRSTPPTAEQRPPPRGRHGLRRMLQILRRPG